MTNTEPPGAIAASGSWLGDEAHRAWLRREALRQLRFFEGSLRPDGGFDVLDFQGRPLPAAPQELHTTARLVHAYALGKAFGAPGCEAIVDAGMARLWDGHRDPLHGGYAWSIRGREIEDGTKLAYGHVFVLLAAASARMAGHPDADRLIADAGRTIDRHYWDEERGLLRDEFRRDWTAFSDYRGMNANMHGVEAMLAVHEATGDPLYLSRAGRILDFFLARVAPANAHRLPEHYTADWAVDPAYEGDPMFRPAGTTPGHSLEFARLLLQHWDLSGRADPDAPARARRLVERALADGWNGRRGGLLYTVSPSGAPMIEDRYWWPVTEAIGAVSALMKADPRAGDEDWYRRLWLFADRHLIDHEAGGWYPELDPRDCPVSRRFSGKPDIYHSLQAALLPLVPNLSRLYEGLRGAPGVPGLASARDRSPKP